MNIAENSIASKANSFNFFINLFDYGEFNELVVTQDAEGYQVKLDNDTFLCTIVRDLDSRWRMVKGNIPASLMNKITQGIDRKLKN
ncbi:hypothetical protein [Arcticibacter sp. MXS-1]|uniref:hypothetical protein n=1 Tax=Arcticibacter sp. MXS-1 TaxID=3341726 RepID=UPI0035A8503D